MEFIIKGKQCTYQARNDEEVRFIARFYTWLQTQVNECTPDTSPSLLGVYSDLFDMDITLAQESDKTIVEIWKTIPMVISVKPVTSVTMYTDKEVVLKLNDFDPSSEYDINFKRTELVLPALQKLCCPILTFAGSSSRAFANAYQTICEGLVRPLGIKRLRLDHRSSFTPFCLGSRKEGNPFQEVEFAFHGTRYHDTVQRIESWPYQIRQNPLTKYIIWVYGDSEYIKKELNGLDNVEIVTYGFGQQPFAPR